MMRRGHTAARGCFGISAVRFPAALSRPKSRNTRLRGLWGLIIPGILLVVCAGAAADPHFALATTPSELLIFRDSADPGIWGGKSWSPVPNVISAGSTLAGVATDGRHVYLAGGSVDGAIIVGTIGNLLGIPTWNPVATVVLKDPVDDAKKVKSPTQIAADGLGGVYVIGEASGGHSYFAHVKPTAGDWTTPIVSIGDLPGATLVDVAVGGSGASAIIAYRKDVDIHTQASHTAKATEAAVSAERSLLDKSYNARAVAIDRTLGTDGYAYVVNYNSDWTFTKGSVRAVDAANGAPLGSGGIELVPGMVPDDVTTFTIGTNHYLGIIGRNSGTGEIWRVPLDGSGNPLPGSAVSTSVPTTTGHQCAASADGEVLWYTSENGTMRALNTTTWTELLPSEFDGTVGGSIKLVYVTDYVPIVIPEPSSILSLAGLLAAGLALLRRRR